jgi:hypothetical protein
MKSEAIPFETGTIVHWDHTPSDRGVVRVDPHGHRVVLWFDEDCHCDDIDTEGNTCWPLDPDKDKGQARYPDGLIYNRRGRLLKRQAHYVVATGEVDREHAQRTHERLLRYLETH